MKPSRRNLQNAVLAAERRSDGRPALSRYAAKHRPEPEPSAPSSPGIRAS